VLDTKPIPVVGYKRDKSQSEFTVLIMAGVPVAK
jgi:hypothetical protein